MHINKFIHIRVCGPSTLVRASGGARQFICVYDIFVYALCLNIYIGVGETSALVRAPGGARESRLCHGQSGVL